MCAFVPDGIMQKIAHGVPPEGRMDSAASGVTKTASWDKTELLDSAKHQKLDVEMLPNNQQTPYSSIFSMY